MEPRRNEHRGAVGWVELAKRASNGLEVLWRNHDRSPSWPSDGGLRWAWRRVAVDEALVRVRTRGFLPGGQDDPFAGEPVNRGDRFDD